MAIGPSALIHIQERRLVLSTSDGDAEVIVVRIQPERVDLELVDYLGNLRFCQRSTRYITGHTGASSSE
ncbi:hypothetical protein HY30_07880 [Hyphomonas chukchiensis]|uniref:Uncharacterized protein n=1 Tax=Hyphomonas chukchiensis TaxID=1280947 RepID=A0A062UHZ4_9PROT|nr:hypothetical protein HY30_07880 [Hyphomonas chukchiensis]